MLDLEGNICSMGIVQSQQDACFWREWRGSKESQKRMAQKGAKVEVVVLVWQVRIGTHAHESQIGGLLKTTMM